MTKKDSYIYLASPYTHSLKWMQEERYKKTLDFVAQEINKGFVIFSPIVHCHYLHALYGMPADIAFWKDFDTKMVANAAELWVLRLSGWEHSGGIKFEIALAQELGLPIEYK